MHNHQSIFKYLHAQSLISEIPSDWDVARSCVGPLLYLEQSGILEQSVAIDFISKTYNIPHIDLSDPGLSTRIDLNFIERRLNVSSFLQRRALPVLIGSKSFVVAFANPFDSEALKLAAFSLDLELKVAIAAEQQIYDFVRNFREDKTLQDDKKRSLAASIERTRVLVIDDDPDIRMLMGHTLSDEQYQVDEAPNGQDGLNKMLTNPPDVVLVDLKMPVLNGEGFLRKVKQTDHLKDIPVVVYTALDTEDYEVNLLNLGAYDFISKRSSHRVVASRIRSALNQ